MEIINTTELKDFYNSEYLSGISPPQKKLKSNKDKTFTVRSWRENVRMW